MFQFEVDSGGSGTQPSVTTTTATITAGSTASYAVTLPTSASNVTVSCLNLPSGASCTYSSSPSVLTVSTSDSTPAGTYQITAVFSETLPGASSAAFLTPFLSLALLRFRKKSGKQLARILGFFALIGLALAFSGCGGGGTGGNAPLPTHQATSSAVITLTVR